MRYALALCITLPLYAPLFKTVVLMSNGSRISMFGDDHDTGAIGTKQYEHIKDLLTERSKDKGKKPIHILLEQPQLFMEPDADTFILQQLSTLAQDLPVTVEDIENRVTVYAAGTLLESDEPEFILPIKFDDGTGMKVNLRDVTYEDLYRLFDFRSKQIKEDLKRLNLVGALFDARFTQADGFRRAMEKNLEYEGCDSITRIATMSEVWRHVRKKREVYRDNIIDAFCPLFDLHAMCRITELLNENSKDVALFAGAKHIEIIAYMLKQRGAYTLHEYSSKTGPAKPTALDRQQLAIFDLQPTVFGNCYLYAKQACAIQ